MRIFNSEQTKMAEDYAFQAGFDSYRLMENAGSAVARVIKYQYCSSPSAPIKIAVICGKGKNGGDGFVVARKLWEFGNDVSIILAAGLPDDKTAQEMMSRVEGIKVGRYDMDRIGCCKRMNMSNILIDAVTGIGFHGEPKAELLQLIDDINGAGRKVISIDVPTGVDCDTGEIKTAAVRAERTIAISTLKPAHITYPASAYCGKTEVVSIGIPEDCFARFDGGLNGIDKSLVKNLMPKRSPVGNKGTFGHLLSICGSMNMPGAAILAAKGALYSGVGLVTVAFPDFAYPAIGAQLTEPLLFPLPSSENGTFSPKALPLLLERLPKASACLIGCGMGVNDHTKQLTYEIISAASCPIIIDADGINSVACNIDILKAAKAPVILTPHPGEMARLADSKTEEVQAARVETASRFSEEYGVTLVLKGVNTVVASQGKAYINTTGNSGMAKGGCGDLLAGMLSSFVAQGMSPLAASVCAVFLHGAAGDISKSQLSERGMTPGDMLKFLPKLLSEYEQQGDE